MTFLVCINNGKRFRAVYFSPKNEDQLLALRALHNTTWNGRGGLESNLEANMTQLASLLCDEEETTSPIAFMTREIT